jgi:hypothetical protein
VTSLYETVPKPPALKRVAHIGQMPVPWVTCYYNGDDPFPVRHTEFGAAEVCDCVPGVGKPLLGKQCPTRQRAAMAGRRCSACGTRIKGVALFAGVYIHTELTASLRSPAPLTAEAPVHPRCLAYSALACPALFAGYTTLVVPVIGDYPLLDRCRLVDPTNDARDDRYDFYPHDTPRPLRLPDGGWPIHEYVYARLDRPGQNVTLLDSWMRRTAPEPYRSTWRDTRAPEPPIGPLASRLGNDRPA